MEKNYALALCNERKEKQRVSGQGRTRRRAWIVERLKMEEDVARVVVGHDEAIALRLVEKLDRAGEEHRLRCGGHV